MGAGAIGLLVGLAGVTGSPRPPVGLRAEVPELAGLGPLAVPDLGACAVPGESVAARVERRTRPIRGAVYARSPLGEGRGPDDDPRIRFDAFDCTTWVETALALATCDERTLLERLDAIRYAGSAVDFAARRHLITAQWVPGLEAAGLVRRTTRRDFPEVARPIRFRLDAARWAKRRIARTLVLPEEAVPRGAYRVDVIPLAYARAHPERLAPGTIIHLVRVDWHRAPDVVTHQGLVLERDGRRFVRHASARRGRVIDETVTAFVERFEGPRKWPVAGVQLIELVGSSGSPSPGSESGWSGASGP